LLPFFVTCPHFRALFNSYLLGYNPDVNTGAMREDTSFDLGAAIVAAKSTFAIPTPAPGQPVLVMLCGLPGTGKSTLAHRLHCRLPAVVVESDRVRQTLFNPSTYTAEESRRVHTVCHILIGWCLRHYYHVVYDATNLYEYHRQLAYRLAERNGARLLVVEVIASEEVIRERLAPRRRGDPAAREPDDYSDADWEVYLRMRRRAEPIQHEHITLDTSDGDIEQAVERVLEAVRG
jgi:predicted kinase